MKQRPNKKTKVAGQSNLTSTRLIVRSTPPITDPRELETILQFSLRNLWGELEPHSAGLEVQNVATHHCDNSQSQEPPELDQQQQQPPPPLLQVACTENSAPFIQAALTWSTLPPYMEGLLYRIDVVAIEKDCSCC